MTDWRENGQKYIAELRNDPERMVDFAAWVFEQTWAAMREQSDTVTLSVDDMTQRSGFGECFLRASGWDHLIKK